MVMACFVFYLPVVIMVSHALRWLQLHSTVTTMSEHGQQLPITMGNNQHGEKHITIMNFLLLLLFLQKMHLPFVVVAHALTWLQQHCCCNHVKACATIAYVLPHGEGPRREFPW